MSKQDGQKDQMQILYKVVQTLNIRPSPTLKHVKVVVYSFLPHVVFSYIKAIWHILIYARNNGKVTWKYNFIDFIFFHGFSVKTAGATLPFLVACILDLALAMGISH